MTLETESVLRYGSVCSGIEAASVAWHRLGWQPSFFSEIDAFPRAVLAHRFPDVPLHGDFTTINEGDYDPIDLLVGGTPCQSFSVAGLRGGLGDDRGNLALEYLRLAQRLRPRWLVWENVPGVLSSGKGRDFGAVLGGMVELGYGFAYRVCDAQYCRVDGFARAVPQRRRRVFVVGYLGDWRRATAVLFERESLSGHPAPRRKAGQGTAAGTGGGAQFGSHDPACTLTAREYKGALPEADLSTVVAHTLRAEGFDTSEDGTGRGTPLVPMAFDARQSEVCIYGDRAAPLDTDGHSQAIAFSSKDHGADAADNVSPTLRAMPHDGSHANGGGQMAVAYSIMPMNSGKDYKARETDVAQPIMAGGPVGGNQGGDYVATQSVRRLTPTECERLQGFPDGWTAIPWRGKGADACPDGPRYKALGNSMAVNVMRWIGRRLAMVEALG